MENKKAKLTKKQAEAIERVIENGQAIHVIESLAKGVEFYDVYAPLNKIKLETAIKSLYVGYEVEETKEEKILAIYENAKMVASTNCRVATIEHYKGQMVAIEQTIDILGIKIKGIGE